MNLRFFHFICFLHGFLSLKGQGLPTYTVDLNNEMHYKVNATNWQERGVKEFRDDVLVLFKKNDKD